MPLKQFGTELGAGLGTAKHPRLRQPYTELMYALMTEAKRKGWAVISMKNDWKRIFAFE